MKDYTRKVINMTNEEQKKKEWIEKEKQRNNYKQVNNQPIDPNARLPTESDLDYQKRMEIQRFNRKTEEDARLQKTTRRSSSQD